MATPNGSRQQTYLTWIGMFLVCWILLSLLCGIVGRSGGGRWIELFNGATFPNAFGPDAPPPTDLQEFWFFVFLGFRTLLNLGFLFTAGGVAYLFYYGLQGNFMEKFNATFRTSNLTLANKIILVLAENGLQLTPEQRRLVRDAAVNFGTQGHPSSELKRQIVNDAFADSHH